jgi:hypothetical protein
VSNQKRSPPSASERIGLISDKARQWAEKFLKKEEGARDGRAVMVEYDAHALATRKKTTRLKELRLAKEAQLEAEATPVICDVWLTPESGHPSA